MSKIELIHGSCADQMVDAETEYDLVKNSL